MNKLIVANGKIIHKDIDKTVKVEEKDSLSITFLKNTTLFLENDNTQIHIVVEKDACVTLLEVKKGSFNHSCIYQIKGHLHYEKLLLGEFCKEEHKFDLKALRASLEYQFSTISDSCIEETITVIHEKEKTTSNVLCHGAVCQEGTLSFEVIGHIPKGSKNSILNQDTKVKVQKDQIASVKPILFIDEQDVEARHACAVGSFEEEQLFYLMSRGIPKAQAEYLLLVCFLKNGMQEEITDFLMETLQKKWR